MPERLDREHAPIVVHGSLDSEHLAIQVFGRLHNATDYSDGNWVHAEVRVQTRGFGGTYPAALRTEEFEQLRDSLRPIYETLRGHATFSSSEGWLTIDIEGDGFGHFDIRYTAVPSHSPLTSLQSSLQIDQTQLPATIRQLDSVLSVFPVIGERPR